jgi:hypothetical protein
MGGDKLAVRLNLHTNLPGTHQCGGLPPRVLILLLALVRPSFAITLFRTPKAENIVTEQTRSSDALNKGNINLDINSCGIYVSL